MTKATSGIGEENLRSKPSSQKSAPGAVDARHLGASQPSDNAPRFTITRTFVDSRGSASGPSRAARPMQPREPGFAPRSPAGSFQRKGGPRGKGPRDRNRGGGGEEVGKKGVVNAEYEEMMEAYEKEKEERLAPKPVAFDPLDPLIEDFYEYGPTTISGNVGKHGLLETQKVIAEGFLNGQQCKGDHYAMANQRQAVATKGLITYPEPASSPEERAKQWQAPEIVPNVLDTLYSGNYISTRPHLQQQGADVVSHVGRQAARNSSYVHRDEETLMASVRRLVATTQPPAGAARAQSVKR